MGFRASEEIGDLAQIAQQSLDVLQSRPVLLNRFATNFSGEVMGGGQNRNEGPLSAPPLAR